MKTLRLSAFVALLSIFFACNSGKTTSSLTIDDQGLAQASFKVWGNCDMCKETIEGSLKTDGITSANWDQDSKMMNVKFDSKVINIDQIHQHIAASGYDTDKLKADDKAYADLPECCQYERK